MVYFLVPKQCIPWYYSLKKYLQYNHNTKSSLLIDSVTPSEEDLILCIYEENENYNKYLKQIFQGKLIRLGCDHNSMINLLDFDKLNSSLDLLLKRKIVFDKPFFSRIEILSKARSIINSHGNQSVLSVLNSSLYYLANGSVLLNQKQITAHEFREAFLLPGLKDIRIVNDRFHGAKYYLMLLGKEGEIGEIECSLNEINQQTEAIKNPDEIYEGNCLQSALYCIVERLKKIDNILLKIYIVLTNESKEIQHTGNG